MKTNRKPKSFKLIIGVALTLLLCQINSSNAWAQSDLGKLVLKSRFIFEGLVKDVAATNISNLPVTDSTSIVRVDKIIYSPGTLGDFTKRDITVQLTKLPTKVDQRAVFFTEILLYAESIAVLEIGRIEAGEDTTELSTKIKDVLLKQEDELIKRRIESSELIIVGQVTDTRSAPEQVRIGPVTEHYPDWWEAEIKVESVEKGEFPEEIIIILFPNSKDVIWDIAPKFSKSQNGIWILGSEKMELFPTQDYLTALDSFDFHPIDQLERIRRLIKDSQ